MEATEKISGGSETKESENETKMESTKVSSKNPTKETQPPKDAPLKASPSSEAKKMTTDTSKLTTTTPGKLSESKNPDEKSKTEGGSSNTAKTSATHNTGNDQVSSDRPQQPLVASTTSSKASVEAQFLPPPPSVPTKAAAAVTTLPASASKSSQPLPSGEGKGNSALKPQSSNELKTAASTPLSSTAPSPIMMDEQSILEQKLKEERRPLTDKYGPYIAPCDTTLGDARLRLHTALEQTRRLRQAFTDRVYKKYRVCLQPVPSTQETLTRILTDPKTCFETLEIETHALNQEKSAEKKEASKLNSEMLSTENSAAGGVSGASLPTVAVPGATGAGGAQPVPTALGTTTVPGNPLEIANAENADQLMYVSAGLSIIVLPEHNGDHLDKKKYPHRAPTDPVTGQRVKGISAAAATAGEVMLDRCRKSAILRAERRSRKAAGKDLNYSRLELLLRNPTAPPVMPSPPAVDATTAAAPATKHAPSSDKGIAAENVAARPSQGKKQSGKNTSSQIPTSAAKAIKARVQATMSVQTLLSLSPTGEELRTDGQLSAATFALMEGGVGSHGSAKAQQRFRHPFPDSAGARGKVSGQKDSVSTSWALPPLPTAKERRNRKQFDNVVTPPASERATEAIQKILTQFSDEENPRPNKRRKIPEVSLMHGIQDFSEKATDKSKSESMMPSSGMDPMLAFHVMQAVGIIEPSQPKSDKTPAEKALFPDNLDTSMFEVAEKRAMGEDGGVSRRSISKLKDLHSKFVSRRCTLSSKIMNPGSTFEVSEQQSSVDYIAKSEGAPVATIRGGGEAVNENEGDTGTKNECVPSSDTAEHKPTNNGLSGPSPVASPQPNPWADACRLVLMNPGASPNHQTMRLPSQIPGVDQYHPNAIQLAHQLRLSRLAASGQHNGNDFSEYLGGLHPQSPQAYDWSAVGAATSAASAQSLAALGITPHRTVNFPMQDGTHAMLQDPAAAAAHRHHQALAYLAGGHGYHPGPGPHFPQVGVMNHPSVFMGRGVPHLTMQKQSPQREVRSESSKAVITDADSPRHKEQSQENGVPAITKEPGKKRKLSDEPQHTPPRKQVKPDDSKTKTASSQNSEKLLQAKEASPLQSDTSKEESTKNPERKRAKKKSHPNGLKFFVPTAPAEVPTDVAALILEARCQEAAALCSGLGISEKSAVVGYLVAVGTAVPLPRTFVAGLFKDKFNASPLKATPLNGIPQASRDVAVATILLWLWRYHEECFQRAFAKSGRLDVDTECKWLITTAIDKAIISLGLALEDPSTRSTTPLAISLMAIKSKNPTVQKPGNDKESNGFVTSSLDLQLATAVSKGLDAGFAIDEQSDAAVMEFNDLLDYLDETRKCALHSKSQERALLAALISRKATMSLSFSHAYVSAMVRAGEALGHGELFEVVQNEEVNVSTMIPYDVFTDESGAWEDPCRPINGYNASHNGDDLMRQAHARAMIQKSLKKLQERHNIKGGTSIPGAYTDPPAAAAGSDARSTASNTYATSSKGAWLKRKPSFSVPPVQRGTGSAAATSWSLYEPKHTSAPLSWSSDCVENTPYGKHNSASKPRSLSLSQFTLQFPGRRGRQARSVSVASAEAPNKPIESDGGGMKRSTLEIPWGDVAGIFQNVNLPGTPRQLDTPATPRSRTIFAPSIRQVKFEDLGTNSDNDSDGEEDLSEEMVLTRHQVVLDKMKEHLSAFFDARKKSQQEKRNRRSSKTGK
eukprot:CAMPEP_0176010860 /NCGR_PEP_ID=MMETSP0120_2-20121206/4989_1 /TAXON_ID=160619 /ORGANISM="Kryptoperidinium foliaceum, Strain CCMP 1326" /LENGTH=1711 /DNA_ID=CAMNT_0017343711 /DNA_START=100 /DNA_END=5235 /DNA_ORIENTATION=-